MIKNIYQKNFYFLIPVFLVIMLTQSCTVDPLDVDVSGVEVDLSVERMEQDLFQEKGKFDLQKLSALRLKYGSFFDLYCLRILNLREKNDSVWVDELARFTADPDMQDIYAMTDSLYRDFIPIEKQFEHCFKYYNYHFPDKEVPELVTMLSAIQYSFIVSDSVLGIALDKYLGSDCKYYPALGFPKFLTDKLTRDHIVIDALQAWYLSDYPEEATGDEMIEKMIHRGKMFYFLDAVAFGLPDSVKIGYSAKQLKWCSDNEYFLWSYLIEHELLFSTNYQKYVKFIDDGFTTSGFPPEAPAQLGSYIGWMIVRDYIKNTNASLPELMNENNAKKILKDSKYKPERKN